MRVIAGKYGSRKLEEFPGDDIRPTADRAKEGIFSALPFPLSGKKVLDLFCGSGALGIEALSRGAAWAVFTDSSKASCELTKRNLSSLKETSPVINTDALSYIKKTRGKFDVIFMDPPYALEGKEEIIRGVIDYGILNEGGLIILESGDVESRIFDGLFILKQKKYGKCAFTFYKKSNDKTAVFAGSFDPVTLGHKAVVQKALETFDKVIVAIGKNKDKVCYFPESTRFSMLEKTFAGNPKVTVTSFSGYLVDFLKANGTVNNIRGIRDEKDTIYEANMLDFNRKLFPEIKNIYIRADKSMENISSSLAREIIKNNGDAEKILPPGVIEIIKGRKAGEYE